MYGEDAARATFEERMKGSISPGKLADLVVLNGDPTKVPINELKDIKVEMTILNGDLPFRFGFTKEIFVAFFNGNIDERDHHLFDGAVFTDRPEWRSRATRPYLPSPPTPGRPTRCPHRRFFVEHPVDRELFERKLRTVALQEFPETRHPRSSDYCKRPSIAGQFLRPRD